MRYAFYSVFILILGVIILAGGIFLKKPQFEFSYALTAFFDDLFSNDDRKKIAELEAENKNLKAEILQDKLSLPNTFKVYATHPFNNIKEIVIEGGTASGQKIGQVVTLGKNILVGKIKEVFNDYSTVATIFDPDFKTEVRIGEAEADGLLNGGNVLKVSLIAKKAVIKKNDIVFTASKAYPYGLQLGHVKDLEETLSSPLKNAIIDPTIRIEDLRNVSVRN